MSQTKQLLQQIKAELDDKVPGWLTAYSSYDKAAQAAGDRALRLLSEYRLAQKQLANAIPTLPKVADGNGARDKDVPIFDNAPAGKSVSAERRDQIGAEIPSLDGDYEDDDAPRKGVSAGRSEDSLWYPDGRPLAARIQCKDQPFRWPHTPPREGAHYGNKCW